MSGGEVTSYIAPWCGYSKKLLNDLETNKDMLASKNIKVNIVDCESPEGKPICQANNVRGFPHTKDSCGNDLGGWVAIDKFVEFAQSCPQ